MQRDEEATLLVNGKEDLQNQLASMERSYAAVTAESLRWAPSVTPDSFFLGIETGYIVYTCCNLVIWTT